MSEGRSTHYAEHCVSLTAVLDGFVDDPVLGGDLIGAGICEVRHPGVVVTEVYLRDALVKKNFGRIEFEFESQLFVIAENKRTSAIEYRSVGYKSAEELGDCPAHKGGRPQSPSSDNSHCLVSPQVQQRVFKVLECEVEALQQKVRDTALKISDSQILVGFGCELEMLDCRLVVAYGGIDEAHVCENL